MCGIIVYYGDAENSLNRVLTGMWAIVYRALDSTGIGVAGSELEPLKIRKELGSVTQLIDRLIVSTVFDEAELMKNNHLVIDFIVNTEWQDLPENILKYPLFYMFILAPAAGSRPDE